MNFEQHNIQHKQAQLRKFSDRLRHLARSGRFFKLSREKQKMLVSRIKRLQRQLLGLIPDFRLSRVFAISALALTMATSQVKGQITFGPKVIDPFGLSMGIDSNEIIRAPELADIDNDGDLDLMVSHVSYYGSRLAYWRNDGTSTAPSFVQDSVTSPFGSLPLPGITFSKLVDLGDDGDLDLFAATVDPYGSPITSFFYFQNAGDASTPLFTLPTTNPFGLTPFDSLYVQYPSFADIDDDGDLDLFVDLYGVDYASSGVFFYENTGTASAPAFAAPIENTFGLTHGSEVYFMFPTFADLDYDGDLDCWATGEYYGRMLYFENAGTSGAAAFAVADTMPFGLSLFSEYAAHAFGDLDGDSDLDLIVGESYNNFAYFENTSPVNRQKPLLSGELNLLPNPSNGEVEINWNGTEILGEYQLTVLNISGQIVSSQVGISLEPNFRQRLELKNESPGIYFVRLENKKSSIVRKLIIR